MKAVESLIGEHQVIARLADALASYAERTKGGRPPEAADLGKFAAVFIDLAERIHHEKEESILLPILVRHGVDWNDGALPAVRREHRQEAYLIDVLRQAGERAGSWNQEDRRRIVASAEALVDFQRRHHAFESAELFPLVGSRLDSATLELLQLSLERFDAEHSALRNDALARARELVERYAPRPAAGMGTAGRRHGTEQA
jgi:hemerythrin-like domain-containing protein